MGTFFGAPVKWTIVFWGLFGGPLIVGNYQVPQASIHRSCKNCEDAAARHLSHRKIGEDADIRLGTCSVGFLIGPFTSGLPLVVSGLGFRV